MEKDLVRRINRLKRSEVSRTIAGRMAQFQQAAKSNSSIFSELCFCILTANYSAEGGIKIQKAMHHEFGTLDLQDLKTRLVSLGHRFPNMRARFICQAREHKGKLSELLCTCDSKTMRNWLAENVYGLGYKEASHFLRNIGITDLAIIDFHIIDILVKNGMIEKPKSKTLSKKRYLEIESILRELAEKIKLTLAELDLYLWHMETGKVLK